MNKWKLSGPEHSDFFEYCFRLSASLKLTSFPNSHRTTNSAPYLLKCLNISQKDSFTRSILCAFAKLRKATVNFVRPLSFLCPSVRPSAWNNSALTGCIFMKIWYLNIFQKIAEVNPSFVKSLTRIK
jgi:hypothetical protein